MVKHCWRISLQTGGSVCLIWFKNLAGRHLGKGPFVSYWKKLHTRSCGETLKDMGCFLSRFGRSICSRGGDHIGGNRWLQWHVLWLAGRVFSEVSQSDSSASDEDFWTLMRNLIGRTRSCWKPAGARNITEMTVKPPVSQEIWLFLHGELKVEVPAPAC